MPCTKNGPEKNALTNAYKNRKNKSRPINRRMDEIKKDLQHMGVQNRRNATKDRGEWKKNCLGKPWALWLVALWSSSNSKIQNSRFLTVCDLAFH